MIRLINLRIVVSKDFSCESFLSNFLGEPLTASLLPFNLPFPRHFCQNVHLVTNRTNNCNHLRLPNHLSTPRRLRETRLAKDPELDKPFLDSLQH